MSKLFWLTVVAQEATCQSLSSLMVIMGNCYVITRMKVVQR